MIVKLLSPYQSITVANGHCGSCNMTDAPSVDAVPVERLCMVPLILLPFHHSSWGQQPVAGLQSQLPVLTKDCDIEEERVKLGVCLPCIHGPRLRATLPFPPSRSARHQVRHEAAPGIRSERSHQSVLLTQRSKSFQKLCKQNQTTTINKLCKTKQSIKQTAQSFCFSKHSIHHALLCFPVGDFM